MTSSTDLARALMIELAHAGLRHVVLCPGSRSAPLAYAAYDLAGDGGLTLHVRHDERVAGFTALGIGRASGLPAVVITTSGTAVANLHPAVLEAHHGGVPLIVVTADRPPRLRGTWANQTSDLQAEMFGAATNLTRDLAPDGDADEWRVAGSIAMAAAQGIGRPAGPVHLNLGFDEPLVPAPGDEIWRPEARSAGAEQPTWAVGGAALVEGPPEGSIELDQRRTVIVAGDGAWPGARRLAEQRALPLLAEPTSGVRSGRNAIGPYRLLLGHPLLGGEIERVIVVGRPTLSRPVTALLARSDVEVVIAATHPADPGPHRSDAHRVGVQALSALLTPDQQPQPTTSVDQQAWLQRWQRAGHAATRAVDAVLDGWPLLTGPLVAREVGLATAPPGQLILAASNPVRDGDLAFHPWPWPDGVGPGTVHANRGLSGIDGTVSTAVGIALATGQATRVLVGDVAFLHDLGALVLGPHEARPDLTVIVLNDDGGGIFSTLEPGTDGERDEPARHRFERLFGTPHGVDIGGVCAGLGVPWRAVASAAGLREQLSGGAGDLGGLRVIEVKLDREDRRPLQDAIGRSVTAALDVEIG